MTTSPALTYADRVARIATDLPPEPQSAGVYASASVASVTGGAGRHQIEQVLVLDGATSAALASLLHDIEQIASTQQLAPNHVEALLRLRTQAFRCGRP